MRKGWFLLLSLPLTIALFALWFASPSRSEMRDDLRLKPEKGRNPREMRLRGKEPAGNRTVSVRLGLRFELPDNAADLRRTLQSLRATQGEALFRAALRHVVKASTGSAPASLETCCARIRDDLGCWYWCCGERAQLCQQECDLLYCDVKR